MHVGSSEGESIGCEKCDSAVLLLAQLCLAAIKQAGWGRVVFVGWRDGSSDSALHDLTHRLADTYAGTGTGTDRSITVNALALVADTDTKAISGHSPLEMEKPAEEQDEDEIAARHPSNAADIANMIIRILSTRHVTGKVVTVHGVLVPR
ncbi:hypothetical protein ACJQWK_00006 [Exserohilum turcicum]